MAAVGIVLLVAAALGATSSAPAANRDAVVTFDDFPGPDEVTFGKNVSYAASLFNDPQAGNSTFTQIQFSMLVPSTTIAGVTDYADLVYASCDTDGTWEGLTATTFSCPKVAQLKPGDPKLQVTTVWKTDPVASTTLCSNVAPVTDCVLATTGTWSIKEGNNTTPSPDTFEIPESTALLVQPNPVRAGGYAIDQCTGASNPNLVTNQDVGPGNKIATAICGRSLPSGLPAAQQDPLYPGVVMEVTERGRITGDPGLTEVSNVCVAKRGFVCPTSQANSWVFTPELADLIFRIPEIGFKRLTTAYHEVDGTWQVFTGCTFDRDGRTKIWTVTCKTPSNGGWAFG